MELEKICCGANDWITTEYRVHKCSYYGTSFKEKDIEKEIDIAKLIESMLYNFRDKNRWV